MADSGEKEYDVVLDALKIHRDKLWKMTNSHNDWGIMDTLRMEQIAKLDEAVQAAGKKEWVGLTDAEIEGAIDEGFAFGLDDGNVSNKYVLRYARTIEAKLKEKNNG
jgi:hypothetical protein